MIKTKQTHTNQNATNKQQKRETENTRMKRKREKGEAHIWKGLEDNILLITLSYSELIETATHSGAAQHNLGSKVKNLYKSFKM